MTATIHKRGEKPKEQLPIEPICGNCQNFESHNAGTPYSRGAGACSMVNQPILFSKKKGMPVEGSVQVFSHFRCSNGHFKPK